MTDFRARLADALQEHRYLRTIFDGGEPQECCTCPWTGPNHKDHLVDVLLPLDGIAIVELPEPDDYSQSGRKFYDAGFTSVIAAPDGRVQTGLNQDVPFAYVRKFAAALLAAANKAESSSSAHGSAGDDRPPRSVCDPDVERGGLPTSMADTLDRLDILQDELERLQHENEELRVYAARDTARLNSELSQALAQRDIARNQRDDARAQLFGMTP